MALWLRGSLWLRGLSGGPLCGSLRAATRHLIVATSWFGGSLRRAATRLPVQSCFMKPSHLRSRAGHAGRGLSRARLSPEVKKTAVTVGRSECRARTTGLRIWPHKQLGTPRALATFALASSTSSPRSPRSSQHATCRPDPQRLAGRRQCSASKAQLVHLR